MDQLEFKRGVVEQLATARRTTWYSRCGCYKVELHAQRLGGRSDLYYALVATGMPVCPWQILGEFKKRETAVAACEKCNKHGLYGPTEAPEAKPRKVKK